MFSRPFGTRKTSVRNRTIRPALETLEDRVTPSFATVPPATDILTLHTSQLTGGGGVTLSAAFQGGDPGIAIDYTSASVSGHEFVDEAVTGPITTIQTDALPSSGYVDITFNDPFSAKPLSSLPHVGLLAAVPFPNIAARGLPPPPAIPVDGNLILNGTPAAFNSYYVHFKANTVPMQIQDNAGESQIYLFGNDAIQLSVLVTVPEPDIVGIDDVNALHGNIYLGSALKDGVNPLVVNTESSDTSGVWTFGNVGAVSVPQPGPPGTPPGEMDFYGFDYGPTRGTTNFTVNLNVDYFIPGSPGGPGVPPTPTINSSDVAPSYLNFDLKAGSTFDAQVPFAAGFFADTTGNVNGNAGFAYGQGSTLIGPGGQTWSVGSVDSGAWDATRPGGPSFIWSAMSTLQGNGTDTLDYSAIVATIPNFDFHVNLATGQATDVSNRINGFAHVIPDRVSIDTPPNQTSFYEQPASSLAISVHATVSPQLVQVIGLPPGLDYAFDDATQTITISGTPTATGSYDVTVHANDASDPTASASVTFQWIVKQPVLTNTALQTSNASAAYGTAVITATVTPASGATSPTGWVTFTIQGASSIPETDPLVNGVATLQQTLAPGDYTITAAYTGDLGFLPSVAVPITQHVRKATPEVSVKSSQSGQTVTFTVTVSGAGAPLPGPTGMVELYVDGKPYTSAALAGSVAQFAVPNLSPGTHTITARYLGDANYRHKRSANVKETVLMPPVATGQASISLAFSTAQPVVGHPFSLTVFVSAMAPGSGTPSGEVEIFIDNEQVATLALTSFRVPIIKLTVTFGEAELKNLKLAAGEHRISIIYLGDAEFLPTEFDTLFFVASHVQGRSP
jgi:hypothetical protein